MRSELAQARQSRYRNPFVYALLALLLLALIAMFLLWRLAKRASAPAWWGGAPGASESTFGPDGHATETPRRRDLPRAALPPGSTWQAQPQANAFGASQFDDLEPALDGAVLRTPDGAPVRPVNTEELFDVQQQSDFFLSLGQHDQAIAVLSEHIADNPGTSALAYLDLLSIFHSLGRRDAYARLRQDFERAFNADVPEFDKFNETGRGLEHYRSALARIESQWPAPGTLALIEELVFRTPGVHEDEAFDLAAYRELLLLYSVAKEVIDPDSAPPAPVTPLSFVDTFGHGQEATAPLPIDADTVPLQATTDAVPLLPASLYGTIDEVLPHDTVLVPEGSVVPAQARAPAAASLTRMDLDLAEFDKTAFETMPAAIEPSAKVPPSTQAADPHVIDFDLFDAATEAEIAPRRPGERKR
ncbi:MAG: tetratricopeptide repeat protein [Comamonadaceae bacterium]|nr:MAG: tetratricopeptide repeat protein [Comamonadaceae bacterium]